MDRPVSRFAIGAVLGVMLSFSISVALVAVFAAFAAVVLFGIAWRSYAAVSGGLSGWGLTWLVLGGSTYMRCMSRAPDCVPSEASLPFLALAGVILVTGGAVGLVGIVRDLAKRQNLRA